VRVPRAGVFPCIVKPAGEDGSAFLDAESVCLDEGEAARAISRLPGPAVVEEFLPGRELRSRGEGRSGLRLHRRDSLSRSQLKPTPANGTEHEDYRNTPRLHSGIDAALFDAVAGAAKDAWRATGIRGYAESMFASGGGRRV
jgi:hypothetical protein